MGKRSVHHELKRKRCSEIDCEKDVGEKVKVSGWVESVRDFGEMVFVRLRDGEDTLQLVFDGIHSHDQISSIPSESVVTAEGVLVKRPADEANPQMRTGSVELVVSDLKVLNKSSPLPFPLQGTLVSRNSTLRLVFSSSP